MRKNKNLFKGIVIKCKYWHEMLELALMAERNGIKAYMFDSETFYNHKAIIFGMSNTENLYTNFLECDVATTEKLISYQDFKNQTDAK